MVNSGDTVKSIFNSCRKLIGATLGYIVVLAEDSKLHEIIYLGGERKHHSIAPSRSWFKRDLSEITKIAGKTMYNNQFTKSTWPGYLPQNLKNIRSLLSSPLVVKGKTIGLLGLANKPGGFTEKDAVLVSGVSELVAVAMLSSKVLKLREHEKLVATLARDLSLRKEVEQKIIVDEDNFEALFENAPVGIAIQDNAGRVVRCNQALEKILGYTETELQQMTFQDFTHPDDILQSQKWAERFFAGRVSNYKIEKRYIDKQSNVIWVTASVTKFKVYNNDIQRIVIIENITERKKVENAINEINEAINIVLYGNQSVLVEGLRYTLQTSKGINFVGQVTNFDECCSLLYGRKIDAVVIERDSAGHEYQSLCGLLAANFPDVKLIIVGSSSYCSKISNEIPYIKLTDHTSESLVSTIKSLQNKESKLLPLANQHGYETLSAKQKQILYLVASGKRNKEIAQELHLSPSTVRNYVSTILQKLEIPNRTAAAAVYTSEFLLKK